jgi:hypothetical protein
MCAMWCVLNYFFQSNHMCMTVIENTALSACTQISDSWIQTLKWSDNVRDKVVHAWNWSKMGNLYSYDDYIQTFVADSHNVQQWFNFKIQIVFILSELKWQMLSMLSDCNGLMSMVDLLNVGLCVHTTLSNLNAKCCFVLYI